MTAEQNILAFLKREYPAWYAVGSLERMEFKNSDGTLASGKSINRRCQELREEGLLEVKYEGKHHAHYRATAPVKLSPRAELSHLMEKKLEVYD